jgi:hypothetical protein
MRLRARCDGATNELPGMSEYVPGVGVVPTRRWRLAGEYAARHRLTGPCYRHWSDDTNLGDRS